MNILCNGQLCIEANGYITGKKCGTFAYLQAPTITEIVNAGTYYPIAGVFVNAPMKDFEADVTIPALRYIGTKKQYFLIQGQGAASSDKATNTITVGSKINGVLQTPGLIGTLVKNVNELYALGAFVVAELERGDEVQIVCTASVDGSKLTFDKVKLLITEFFD